MLNVASEASATYPRDPDAAKISARMGTGDRRKR